MYLKGIKHTVVEIKLEPYKLREKEETPGINSMTRLNQVSSECAYFYCRNSPSLKFSAVLFLSSSTFSSAAAHSSTRRRPYK
jgi:hypothetical protein